MIRYPMVGDTYEHALILCPKEGVTNSVWFPEALLYKSQPACLRLVSELQSNGFKAHVADTFVKEKAITLIPRTTICPELLQDLHAWIYMDSELEYESLTYESFTTDIMMNDELLDIVHRKSLGIYSIYGYKWEIHPKDCTLRCKIKIIFIK